MTKEQPNVHVIKDEKLGGVLREYVEVERGARVGDFIVTKFGESDHYFTENNAYEVVGAFSDGEIDVIDNEGNEHGLSPEYYTVIAPTDVIHYEGKRYKMVERKAEVGKRVIVLVGNGWYRKNVGGVFTVIDGYEYGFNNAFTYVEYPDNVKDDQLHFISNDNYRVLEPIAEETPVIVDESQASPQVVEMLANLAQRIVALESQLADHIESLEQHALRITELEARNDTDELAQRLAKLIATEVRNYGRC